MTEFQLTRMAVIDGAPNPTGNRLLATFDMLIAGLRVGGCVLIQKADGCLMADGPKGKTMRGHKAHVLVEDESLKQAITDRAAMLYEGFTGRTHVGQSAANA